MSKKNNTTEQDNQNIIKHQNQEISNNLLINVDTTPQLLNEENVKKRKRDNDDKSIKNQKLKYSNQITGDKFNVSTNNETSIQNSFNNDLQKFEQKFNEENFKNIKELSYDFKNLKQLFENQQEFS